MNSGVAEAEARRVGVGGREMGVGGWVRGKGAMIMEGGRRREGKRKDKVGKLSEKNEHKERQRGNAVSLKLGAVM